MWPLSWYPQICPYNTGGLHHVWAHPGILQASEMNWKLNKDYLPAQQCKSAPTQVPFYCQMVWDHMTQIPTQVQVHCLLEQFIILEHQMKALHSQNITLQASSFSLTLSMIEAPYFSNSLKCKSKLAFVIFLNYYPNSVFKHSTQCCLKGSLYLIRSM